MFNGNASNDNKLAKMNLKEPKQTKLRFLAVTPTDGLTACTLHCVTFKRIVPSFSILSSLLRLLTFYSSILLFLLTSFRPRPLISSLLHSFPCSSTSSSSGAFIVVIVVLSKSFEVFKVGDNIAHRQRVLYMFHTS